MRSLGFLVIEKLETAGSRHHSTECLCVVQRQPPGFTNLPHFSQQLVPPSPPAFSPVYAECWVVCPVVQNDLSVAAALGTSHHDALGDGQHTLWVGRWVVEIRNSRGGVRKRNTEMVWLLARCCLMPLQAKSCAAQAFMST